MSIYFTQTDKPIVSVRDQRVTAWESSTFSVSCSFDANPTNTEVIWLKDDVILPTDQRTTVLTDGGQSTLTISSPKRYTIVQEVDNIYQEKYTKVHYNLCNR